MLVASTDTNYIKNVNKVNLLQAASESERFVYGYTRWQNLDGAAGSPVRTKAGRCTRGGNLPCCGALHVPSINVLILKQ